MTKRTLFDVLLMAAPKSVRVRFLNYSAISLSIVSVV